MAVPFSVLNCQTKRPMVEKNLVIVKNYNDLDLWKIENEEKNVNSIINEQLYYINNKDNNPVTMVAPANDGICGAILLSNTECYPRVAANWTLFNNSTATWEASPGIPGCWGFFYGATVWYKFTATSTSQLITTDWYSGAGGNIDSQIAVYSSSNGLCTGVMTRIGCDEDITVSPGDAYGNSIPYAPDYFAETTLLGLTIGTTYYIRVDGQYDACGFGCWTPGTGLICTQVGLPNDKCETAQSVSVNIVYSTTNNGASPISQNAVPDKSFTCGSTENMIYFSFTSPATDIFYINQWAQTCTYNRGTQFIIYKSAYTCAGIPDSWVSAGSSTYELYCSSQSLADRNFSMNFVAGQTYIIAIDGGAGDECTFDWEITQSVPLPVEMISFNCFNDETSIKLKWVTVSEHNSDYFTVERSIDGVAFYEIARVNAAGQSSSNRIYEYIDKEPLSDGNYYRLSETDFNGDTKKFEVIKCNTNIKDEEVYLELVNMAGQIVAKKMSSFNNRNDILKSDNIPIGVYVLKINKKGIFLEEKCVKYSTNN